MKRLVFVLIATLCLMMFCTAIAETYDVEWYSDDGEVYNSLGEHFRYDIEGDHAVLTSYWMEQDKPQPAIVEVPAAINGYPLTTIGWCAFDNWDAYDDLPDGQIFSYDGEKVERIIIPEGVTTLADGAFCEAEHVDAISLPSSLNEIVTGLCFEHVRAEIDFPNGNAFYQLENGFLIDSRTESLIYCNLTARNYPLPRVRQIEEQALDNYHGFLKVLEFPDSVEYIGSRNAYDNVNLETIIVPGSVVEIADKGLFCNTATKIVLNEGLKRIGAYAFEDTMADNITVPSTVEWIGYNAFGGSETILLNPDCIMETELQYNSRLLAEATRDAEVLYSSDEWPMRKLEIINEYDERNFLLITMQDGSGLMYISTILPSSVSFDEYHASNTHILLNYPKYELSKDADFDDSIESELFFMTFEYIDQDWRLTSATNGQDWTVRITDGIYVFDDYNKPDGMWQWKTTGEDRLTEFYFSEFADMVNEYNRKTPARFSLQDWIEE